VWIDETRPEVLRRIGEKTEKALEIATTANAQCAASAATTASG
jgi:hypothetical protein